MLCYMSVKDSINYMDKAIIDEERCDGLGGGIRKYALEAIRLVEVDYEYIFDDFF